MHKKQNNHARLESRGGFCLDSALEDRSLAPANLRGEETEREKMGSVHHGQIFRSRLANTYICDLSLCPKQTSLISVLAH